MTLYVDRGNYALVKNVSVERRDQRADVIQIIGRFETLEKNITLKIHLLSSFVIGIMI